MRTQKRQLAPFVVPIGLAVLAFQVFITSACSSEAVEAVSMEQLYKEQGVPVQVETVKPDSLTRTYVFHAVLTGIEESKAESMISDRVEAVHYKVGDYVEKDTIVLSFPSRNPTAQYHQAKVAFELAETTLVRMKNLYESGGISLQDYDGVRTQYEVAKANWDAVRQSVHMRSPISGVITSLRVRVSDNVHPGDHLFTVSRTDRLKAELWIRENLLAEIDTGTEATASWGDVMLKGCVVQVDRSLDPRQQAFGAVAVFDNPGRRMTSGVNGTITLFSQEEVEGVVIARDYLVREDDKYYVFLDEEGTARKRQVEIGRPLGMDVPVLSGLQPGDRLIVSGTMNLRDGARIRPVAGLNGGSEKADGAPVS
jgi:RND family efflux transporter MFP subunit